MPVIRVQSMSGGSDHDNVASLLLLFWDSMWHNNAVYSQVMRQYNTETATLGSEVYLLLQIRALIQASTRRHPCVVRPHQAYWCGRCHPRTCESRLPITIRRISHPHITTCKQALDVMRPINTSHNGTLVWTL